MKRDFDYMRELLIKYEEDESAIQGIPRTMVISG